MSAPCGLLCKSRITEVRGYQKTLSVLSRLGPYNDALLRHLFERACLSLTARPEVHDYLLPDPGLWYLLRHRPSLVRVLLYVGILPSEWGSALVI